MRPSSFPVHAGAVAGWLAACLLAVAGSHADAASPVKFAPNSDYPGTLIEAVPRADAATQIRLIGNWPTPCMPTVESATLVDRDIRVQLRSHKGLCARIPVPFDITLDPPTQFGRALEPGVYRVSLFAANSPLAEQELRGFGLVEIGTPATVRAESGFWWPDTSREGVGAPGTGVSFEIQGDTLAAALFGFGEIGEQAWYFGTGAMAARSASLDLVGIRGGAPILSDTNTADLQADDSLVFYVEFESNARATAWFGRYERGTNQPKLRLRAIPLVRQPLTASTEPRDWQGEWVLLRESTTFAPLAERLRLTAPAPALQGDQPFELTGYGYTLKCERDPHAEQSPPRRCLLDAAGAPAAEFDSVGINRLDGRAVDGSRIQLLRVDRRP